MHEQYRNTHPCGGNTGGGPAFLYGYCHDSGQMRMMNVSDYMRNMQTGYTNMAQAPATLMQQMVGMTSIPAATSSWQGHQGHHRHHDHGCGCHDKHEKKDCGCHGGHDHHDCGCECCIRCADTVEYARCGETRKIPITFDNDSRRDRAVTLELGSFLTDGGKTLPWQASLSETTFQLGPCGEKTVLLTVTVDCGQRTTNPTTNEANGNDSVGTLTALESCLVGYATIRAEGCLIRPLIVAVAALPDRCGAHHIGCLCGCCC